MVDPEKTKIKSPQEAGIKMLRLGDVARCKALRWFCVSGGFKGHFVENITNSTIRSMFSLISVLYKGICNTKVNKIMSLIERSKV